jgi:alpha-galactosidase
MLSRIFQFFWVLAAIHIIYAEEPKAPAAAQPDSFTPLILTPPAAPKPRINGPTVFGVRPGAPFLYSIPVTGTRPVEFAAEGLPGGLILDHLTGQITGVLDRPGEYVVILKASNSLGAAEKRFRIIVGGRIALTPPLGWNSWNCWGGAVSQDKVLSSARAIVEKGLRDHGWTYVNIDDGWQGIRGGPHMAILQNSKFPNMKALADEIHGLGLKFGIYSTPWRGTYEGHIGGSSDNVDGSYDWIKSGNHNEDYRVGKDPKTQSTVKRGNWVLGAHSFSEQDAAQWAEWGVDYLKYDWFPNDIPHSDEMARALRKGGRDVVFSLSNTAIYDHAAEYARCANSWRSTGDIRDTWESISHIGFSQDRWAGYTGSGHWTDADMLVVGQVGWGPSLHKTRLTPNEQYTHVSLWSLLSSPLLIGCDVAQMDDFTVGLLTNDEVLEVNQDALGKQATQISNQGEKVIYAKTLEDDAVAVGLFNRGDKEQVIGLSWGPWGTLPSPDSAKRTVRDLWRQKDLGAFDGKFEAKVPAHGVVLVKLSRGE